MGRVFIQVYKQEIKKLLSYRADFWIYFAGGIITQVTLAYFLWKAVFDFSGAVTMGGFSFTGLMFYYLMVPVVERMIRGAESNYTAQEIYDGTLSRYLIYPVNFFSYKYAVHLAYTTVFFMQFIIIIGIFSLFFPVPAEYSISPGSIAGGISIILLGTVLSYTMIHSLEMVAFWAEHVWSLVVSVRMLSFFASGAMIPFSFFPQWGVSLLSWLPFAYLTSFPIRTFSGHVGFAEYLRGIEMIGVWISVFSFLMVTLWKKGLKNYSGAGI
jgi:ABC-2 type transport system permease protein